MSILAMCYSTDGLGQSTAVTVPCIITACRQNTLHVKSDFGEKYIDTVNPLSTLCVYCCESISHKRIFTLNTILF
jgi:hypothetical protein